MYEPVLSGSYRNMGGTGTPAIPENNSLNYSAASSTVQPRKNLRICLPPIHEPLPTETTTPAPAKAKANERRLVR